MKSLLRKLVKLSIRSRGAVVVLAALLCLIALASGAIDGNWRSALRLIVPAGLLAGALHWLRRDR